MEFEQLKKIWDVQTSTPIYAINETAMHNRISSKKTKGLKISNISEFLTIMVNLGGGLFILFLNVAKEEPRISLFMLSGWMLLVSLFTIISRMKRLQSANRFDRSMHGDLLHALSVASYQVRFSQLMRWNSLPIALLIFFSAWESGRAVWMGVATTVFILIVNYAAGWEHNIYKSRRNELQSLKDQLEKEPGAL